MKNKGFLKLLREGLLIGLSLAVVFAVVRFVSAGSSLTPLSGPSATLHNLSDIYNPLASVSFDSSSVVANPNGNSLQILKCALNKARGGTCP